MSGFATLREVRDAVQSGARSAVDVCTQADLRYPFSWPSNGGQVRLSTATTVLRVQEGWA